MIWAHFMGNSRGVHPYPEHWKYLDQMLADPAFRHVDIVMGTNHRALHRRQDHLKMTADLIRKYPDRFLYSSEQGTTTDWKLVKKL
jgi:hypothetical protein